MHLPATASFHLVDGNKKRKENRKKERKTRREIDPTAPKNEVAILFDFSCFSFVIIFLFGSPVFPVSQVFQVPDLKKEKKKEMKSHRKRKQQSKKRHNKEEKYFCLEPKKKRKKKIGQRKANAVAATRHGVCDQRNDHDGATLPERKNKMRAILFFWDKENREKCKKKSKVSDWMIFKIQQESDNQFVLKNEQIKSLMRRCQNNKMRAILFFLEKEKREYFLKIKGIRLDDASPIQNGL